MTNFATEGILIKPFQMKFRRARNRLSHSTVPGVSDLKKDKQKITLFIT